MVQSFHMEKATITQEETLNHVYEAGYQISPVVKEEDVESVISGIRSQIEKAGGLFIAEGAPVLTKLSYSMFAMENGKKQEYDRAYFGWLKFETTDEAAMALEMALKADARIIRHIVFRTVREETRARLKAPTLREVKRTDILKAIPRREEVAAPVSEEDIDKAIEGLTVE